MKSFLIAACFVAVCAPGLAQERTGSGPGADTVATTSAHYVALEQIDLEALLPPPPEPDSIAGRADLETVLHVQESRTPEQVAWAKFVEEDDLFKHARVLGDWFTAENLPQLAAFFQRADEDGLPISRASKALHPKRLRPAFLDTRVQACVEVPKSSSYPSGHSSHAWMWAVLLGEIFPEKRVELYERARQVEWARIIGGVHFPTDTEAGRRLGEAIAREMLKNPKAREEIQRCRAEAEPFLKAQTKLKKAA